MSQIAKRYAEALFQLAKAKNTVSEVSIDLKELVIAFKETPELLAILQVPKISANKKKELLKNTLANANEIVRNTIQLLVDKQRINEIPAVAEEFQVLAAAAQGAAEATVYSTRLLTEEETSEISRAFSSLVGKEKLNINNVVEPSLIGGIRVQIGNYIFDSTVASKLEGLKRTLVG